ncbi:hypothetical protein PAECIP111891_00639 [Paenibacillus allorhizoplanae]|uniref:GH26 domain-containing protein n=1 Tax=Paenibacillus allorhizoplanae TaxID=2905648 RepID=A0ABN8G3F1_9BACL|nr:glycosyl hydrolase [Paenibacillus allorhizoplanae]CAH1195275.1 hypothetical protein PAECIP111891_00639 [Paenibacillus allorhizoplanae]
MLNTWLSKLLATTLIVVLLGSGLPSLGAPTAHAATPVNPNATQAVQDVLNYFDTVQTNNQIISGQYVRGQNYGYLETDHLYNLTGKYPALIGYDLLYNVTNASDLGKWRSFIVDHATDYWKKGGLVTLSWHETIRTEDANWKDFIVYDSSSRAALHVGLQGNFLKVYDGATTLSSIEPITSGTWYDIKVIMNTDTKKFDIYVNGAKKANQFSFKNTAASDVSRLKVGVAADATGVYYMDNVFISK